MLAISRTIAIILLYSQLQNVSVVVKLVTRLVNVLINVILVQQLDSQKYCSFCFIFNVSCTTCCLFSASFCSFFTRYIYWKNCSKLIIRTTSLMSSLTIYCHIIWRHHCHICHVILSAMSTEICHVSLKSARSTLSYHVSKSSGKQLPVVSIFFPSL